MLRNSAVLFLLVISSTITLSFAAYSGQNEAIPSELHNGTASDSANTTAAPVSASAKLPTQNATAPQKNGETSSNSTAPVQGASSALELALKGFLLSQGEGGNTLWQLKATSGNMAKEGSAILIDKPDLVYYLPPDNAELHISSDKGEVDQAKKIIRFMGNVTLTSSHSTIKSDVLIYNGETRVMELPQGGTLEGTGTSGTAEHIIWHLDTRIVECTGQVETKFSTSEDIFPPATSKTPSGGV